jgi:hypothetical protein
MRTAPIKHATPGVRPGDGEDPALARLRAERIAELDRLRKIGLEKAERLAKSQQNLPPEQGIKLLIGRNGAAEEFIRVTRAIRQLVVLEFELRGIFAAPDRDAPPKAKILRFARNPADRKRPDLDDFDHLDDWKVRPDYDAGPLDAVVAEVRRILDAHAPEKDPFAPPAERKTPPAERKTPPAERETPKSEPAPRPTSHRDRPAAAPRKAAMGNFMGGKPGMPKPPAAPAKNAVPPAQAAPPLNRHQRRKAERRARQGRGPPK